MATSARTTSKVEFGDFQTPYELATDVCQVLSLAGMKPRAIIEPTCGEGNFLLAAVSQFPDCKKAVGIDINPRYVTETKAKVNAAAPNGSILVQQGDFFAFNWYELVEQLPTPLLVIGNPPWVTNSQLGAIGSDNLPLKTNFQSHNGIDAITGKSNFDISEWMLLKILDWLNSKHGTLAMLCKASVARKVLTHAWKNGYQLKESRIYSIDALKHFEAAVEACLLVCSFAPEAANLTCKVYSSLDAALSSSEIGYKGGVLLADINYFTKWRHLFGSGPQWRSGIKHDCSKIMELYRDGSYYVNGLGERVELEADYLYPMLKSSELVHRKPPTRFMIVTQQYVGEDTNPIRQRAPKTWQYLQEHAAYFDKRASSIYRDKPPFSIFGVGDYSFSPWKVAISGLYKSLEFVIVGTMEGKPIVLDDTQNFLPCQSYEDAQQIADTLNSDAAKEFFRSFIFWDEKRPITIQRLKHLDLHKLLKERHPEHTSPLAR